MDKLAVVALIPIALLGSMLLVVVIASLRSVRPSWARAVDFVVGMAMIKVVRLAHALPRHDFPLPRGGFGCIVMLAALHFHWLVEAEVGK